MFYYAVNAVFLNALVTVQVTPFASNADCNAALLVYVVPLYTTEARLVQ